MSDDVTITVRVDDRTVTGFRDVNGRLRDMRGRFASTAGDMRRSSDDMNRSVMSLRSSAMSLSPSLMQVGAVLGTALLPAIGAAVPAVLGLGAAAGTLKLGFAGVGDAMAASSQGHKQYAEALKKLSPEARSFTKSLVDVKKEFGGIGKEIQKEMLPGFTKAVKDAGPVVKILGSNMTGLAKSFGDMAEKAGKALQDSGLQKDLQQNLKMGSDFAMGMAGSFGTLGKSLLDFGAKSGPTLDGFQNLLGGLMDTGLPGFFKGLEPGIQGAADVINGLAYALNDKLLPAFGDFVGKYAEATGPLFKQAFMALGDVGGAALNTLGEGMKAASPLLHDLAEGLRGARTVAGEFAPVMKDVGKALLEAFIPGDIGEGPLTRLADSIDRNKGAIQEGARIIGDSIISFVQAGVSALPLLVEAFSGVSIGILTALDGIVSGAAAAFGWVPGIGAKFKAANEDFDTFASRFKSGLGDAQTAANSFASSTGRKLSAGKLKLDINSWSAQLETAKAKLKTVPASKQSALRATIRDLEAKIAQAKRDLNNINGRTATVRILTQYFTAKSPAQLAAAHGRAFGGLAPGYAGGGEVQSHPDGGLVAGPGTGTSDSILELSPSGSAYRTSDREFIVKASSVSKYGVPFLDAVNSGTLKVAGFARGGVTKAEAQARKDAKSDLTISHFGHMGGYQRSEFRSALAKPADLSSLINSLNQWRGIIQKATHGGQERTLLKALDSSGKKLLSWEKQLGKVEASLSSAKDKLNDLKSSASQLSDSVKSGILSSSNITKNASGGPVTVASIMGGLTQARDKDSAFAGALASLKKKGLSSALLQQIGEAGIEGGGLETAGALQGASSSEIKSLNSLQSQITSSASAAGKTTSDAVYGKAIAAQERTVKSLTASQNKLKLSMDRLAASMEKMVERAFGKKAAGGIVGAAATGGLRSGLTMVGEQGFELLDLPAGARVWSHADSRRKVAEAQAPWASMLNTPRRGPSYGASAGGAQEVKVVLEIVAGNSNQYSEFLVNELRKAVRTRGGMQATFQPPRGR